MPEEDAAWKAWLKQILLANHQTECLCLDAPNAISQQAILHCNRQVYTCEAMMHLDKSSYLHCA